MAILVKRNISNFSYCLISYCYLYWKPESHSWLFLTELVNNVSPVFLFCLCPVSCTKCRRLQSNKASSQLAFSEQSLYNTCSFEDRTKAGHTMYEQSLIHMNWSKSLTKDHCTIDIYSSSTKFN